MTTNDVYNQVVVELGYFKFHRNCMAYKYLIDAIVLVYKNNAYIRNFSSSLYVDIAKKYGTKPENVSWSISKLLSTMYMNTEEKVIKQYFKLFYYEKPSPKAFIIYVAEKVEQKLVSKQKKFSKISWL